MVIWITGLSGAGKTTLCNAIHRLVKPVLPELVVLDGDVVREAFGNDLTHSAEDRTRQFHRLQNFSNVLSRQGLVVLVAAVYNTPELLAWNRENLASYFEIYLKCSLETAERRDAKGLYAQARRGEVKDVVGVDIPYCEPCHADLVVNADDRLPPEKMARQVIGAVPAFQSNQV